MSIDLIYQDKERGLIWLYVYMINLRSRDLVLVVVVGKETV